MNSFRSTILSPLNSEETLSEKSSCYTVIPAAVGARTSSPKGLANKSASSTPRASTGIFRRRTTGSMQLHGNTATGSMIQQQKNVLVKRSNTAIGLHSNSSATAMGGMSSTSLAKIRPPCSGRKQIDRLMVDEKTVEKPTPCKHSPSIHKLGTVPKYLNKTSIHSMRSTFNSKCKQFASKRTEHYERQKCVMEQYRALLDMQKKLNGQTGKSTKLDELDVIAYTMDGFYLCLCMGSVNYGKLKRAMDGAENVLNEWTGCGKAAGADEANVAEHVEPSKVSRITSQDIN